MESLHHVDSPKRKLANNYDLTTSKQQFESDDSEGSDLSYQSSFSSSEDNDDRKVQYFKEEMARFFINYPELLNKNMFQSQSSIPEQSPKSIEPNANQENYFLGDSTVNHKKINKHWEHIAEDIFAETKQSSNSLESLAKKLALFRFKTEETDIIELLLSEKDRILNEIEEEISVGNVNTPKHKKSIPNKHENSEAKNFQPNEKIKRSQQAQQINNSENYDHMYLSWRKQKESFNKNQPNQNTKAYQNQTKSQSLHKFKRSLSKAKISTPQSQRKLTPSLNNKNGLILASNKKLNEIGNKVSKFGLDRIERVEKEALEASKNLNIKNNQADQHEPIYTNEKMQVWKHLVNFDPKTEMGRQLSEEIKKNNNPNDEAGIKKTILTFLVRYKDVINHEIINKSTISQKIQKLYNDDAKELLMFYPSKTSTYENANQTQNTPKANQNSEDLREENQKFINLIKEISEGPLMKYWQQMQESRI